MTAILLKTAHGTEKHKRMFFVNESAYQLAAARACFLTYQYR
jgi:hypothetical protein